MTKRKDQFENEEEMIQNILNHFDFQKCNEVMTLLNWKWFLGNYMGIPTIEDMKKSSVERLRNAIKGCKETRGLDIYCVSSGGFKASACKNRYGHITFIKLEFVLTEWDES